MKRGVFSLVVAVGSILFLRVGATWGQFTIVSQTRTISSTATGDINGSPYGTQQTPSTTSTVGGTFNQSDSASKTDGEDFAAFQISSSASQNTTVSSSGFSGTVSASASTLMAQGEAFSISGVGAADSDYAVNFTVAAPTEINITATLTVSQSVHEGPFSYVNWTEQITNSSTTVASNSFSAQVGDFDSVNSSGPLPLSATLEPGNTYTLSMGVDPDFPGNDVTTQAPISESLTFSGTGEVVPEPASFSLLVISGLAALARPKRRDE
jgi:hypothetical protein